MSRLYYDFHIHSCLSPCGDDEATPASIAGFAKLAGLDAAALTDHNTCDNCPAFFDACEQFGVLPVAGMELTTAEDIHLVCLFETLAEAMSFSEEISARRILIRNRPQIFGRQLVMDSEDAVVREEEHLLTNATTLDLASAFELAAAMNGVCYPAHVDRVSNGIIAVLGAFPEKPPFTAAEFRDTANIAPYCRDYPRLNRVKRLFGSDAHRLSDLPDAQAFVEISSDDVRGELFRLLRGHR